MEPEELEHRQRNPESPADKAERQAKRLSKTMRERLSKLLERHHITDWDLLLIGDGSGSNWKYPCGWGCVSIERHTLTRETWAGATNRGTVNFAEIMAYIQPLLFYATQEEERRRQTGGKHKAWQIHIITDSEYCKNQGLSADMSPNRNGALWRMFDDFQRQGMFLNWHWAPRETVGQNIFADALSKEARQLMKNNDLCKIVETQLQTTIHDINPLKRPESK